jgi:hypothetical protein
MRRAVILVTLILLLLAVAGITVAQESDFSPEGDYQTEPTSLEATTGEPTEFVEEEPVEEDERTAGDVLENSEEPVADDSDVTEDRAAKGESKREKRGKPKGVGKPEGVGRPEDAGEPVGKGKPAGVGKEKETVDPGSLGETRGGGEEANGGGNQQKVTLCHKGKNTIAVGAPAGDAHLRHGDSLGECAQ